MEALVKQERSLLQPTTIQEAMQYAEMMSKSSLVPESFRGKPGDVLIAVQLGAEVGLSPVQSLQSIAVINGRPAIWGDGLMGLVLASGLMENYKEMTAEEIEKAQRAEFWCKRKGMPEPIIRSFSVSDAQKAGLWKKPGVWQGYPYRMLQMRARSWALRDGFADVLKGLQCREEVEDYMEPRDITPAPTIQAPRRLSEKAPEPAHTGEGPETKVCEPISRGNAESGPTQEPPSHPTEFTTRTSLGNAVHVENINTKTGSKNGREWTAFFIKFSSGMDAGTFDTKLADACRDAFEGGYPVIVTTTPNAKNPEKYNLVSVVRAEEPMTDADIRF